MTESTAPLHQLKLRKASIEDCDLILSFIRELAEYERLAHEVEATEAQLSKSLFGDRPAAEVIIAEWSCEPAGFALFFGNYSTFLAKPGIYLEDLFVRPRFRGKGIGLALLSHLAGMVSDRDGGRLDWWVLHWNELAIDFYTRLGAEKLDDWLPMRLSGNPLRSLARAGHQETAPGTPR